MGYSYYNANPRQRRVNDCTVRAISLATGRTWDQTFEELSKNQTKLAELFEKVNEATGDSPYKVYSIGQKDKSDLLKNYTI